MTTHPFPKPDLGPVRLLDPTDSTSARLVPYQDEEVRDEAPIVAVLEVEDPARYLTHMYLTRTTARLMRAELDRILEAHP